MPYTGCKIDCSKRWSCRGGDHTKQLLNMRHRSPKATLACAAMEPEAMAREWQEEAKRGLRSDVRGGRGSRGKPTDMPTGSPTSFPPYRLHSLTHVRPEPRRFYGPHVTSVHMRPLFVATHSQHSAHFPFLRFVSVPPPQSSTGTPVNTSPNCTCTYQFTTYTSSTHTRL